MKVGVQFQPLMPGAAEFAQEAERLGVDSLWTPEVWGYDALTGLATIAARTARIRLGTFVVQLGSRSPALLAGSALSMQQLSNGRFTLGVGTSGPGVMEGWHGVRFGKPIRRTRETIEIIRIISRGERLEYAGEVYPLPLPDSEGKALIPLLASGHVPVYVAAMGPANLRLTGEIADGWLGNAFIPELADVFLGPIRAGAASVGRDPDDIDLVVPAAVQFTRDHAETAREVRRHADGYAFTIGAMGSASNNFYNKAFARLGFAEEVAEVARLWRDGDRQKAAAGVPIELGERTNLIGTPDVVAQRVTAYEKAGVKTILAKLEGDFDEQLKTLRSLIPLVHGE
ncbi:LLM class flavin-dependent oxidoreductase [Streptomyces chartreusis]|uniref:LLM class flavin-dependent oxidoreductase n=1 Tax=Streptomyces chartreusis TaxID=1969 RepID=UPI0033FD79F9